MDRPWLPVKGSFVSRSYLLGSQNWGKLYWGTKVSPSPTSQKLSSELSLPNNAVRSQAPLAKCQLFPALPGWPWAKLKDYINISQEKGGSVLRVEPWGNLVTNEGKGSLDPQTGITGSWDRHILHQRVLDHSRSNWGSKINLGVPTRIKNFLECKNTRISVHCIVS